MTEEGPAVVKVNIGLTVGLIGAVLGILSFGFNYLQNRENAAIERGELRQVITDLRARVSELERAARYLHGDITTPK